MDVTKLNIEVIDQIRIEHNEEMILFTIEGFTYEMIMRKDLQTGAFYPRNVFHEKESKVTDRCSVCNYTKLVHCMPLYLHANALFRYLCEFPTIRLYWIGKNHI